MVIAYGVAQPFLPAALTDDAAVIWRLIAVLRGLGWYMLLPFLGYGILAPFGQRNWRHLSTYLALVSVIVILVASYMAAGDQWDNPRYRTSFIALQAALAGWGWAHAQRSESPWLRRLAVLLAGFVLIFLQWYLGRYYGTPSLDLLATLAFEVVFAVGYLVVCLAFDLRRGRRQAEARPG
jgi:NADH:ubiquinone oxidoreductase subunit 5 (subunit L)/multisubunit Na+/H+ antiporter MnhA subunit